jgi:hypothetical protein
MKFNADFIKRMTEKKRNIFLIKTVRALLKRIKESAHYFNYNDEAKLTLLVYKDERAILEDHMFNIKKMLEKRGLLITMQNGVVEIMLMETNHD